jgi:tetratricopeptide (TPR) repeat protein
VILFFAIFITVLGVSAEPAGPSNVSVAQLNSISGYVSDERRAPIPDLQVELLNDVESVIQRTKTDSSGLYAFRRLTSGIFQVRVQPYETNYIGQTQRVQLERTRAFEQVDFVLRTKQSGSMANAPGVVFAQDVPEQARKQYERGNALLGKAGQEKEGVETLKKAIEIFPLYFAALELLGAQYVKEQNYDAAVPVLTKAIEVNGKAYQSLQALSVAQFSLKQMPEALDSMRRSIAINQSSATANLWFGMLLRQASKLDEAEPYLKQAVRLSPAKLPDAHWQLALLFNQLKRYKEAADELETFLKIQPDSRDKEMIQKLIQQLRQKSADTAKP